jgi:hypothetical protein
MRNILLLLAWKPDHSNRHIGILVQSMEQKVFNPILAEFGQPVSVDAPGEKSVTLAQ